MRRAVRPGLAALALIAGAALAPRPAAADGTLSMRGVYYKERATRVMQPMLDTTLDVGTRGLLTANFLVDAITSASASSGAVNDVAFTETRYEAGGTYTHELRDLRLGGQVRYSTESDYVSYYGGVRGELDVAQKNATLGLGVGVSRDEISAGAAQGGLAQPTLACAPGRDATSCPLTHYLLFATASQVLSKNAVLGLTYDLAFIDGFQSNPYRQALAMDGIAPERHPTERLRQAFAATLRYYLPRPQLTVIGAYRYYRDDWDVHAHTPEVRLIQQVGRTADASFRYRLHVQDAAYFYQDRYDTIDAEVNRYLSDDVKLDAFTGHMIEAKLGVLGEAFGMDGRWAGARFEGILQYLLQHERFGNAIIAHVALTVPLDE